MNGDYKARKEAFVSDLTGGSVGEIVLITMVPLSAILLWSVLQSRQRFFDAYSPPVVLVEFLLNCVAVLLATTQYSSALVLLNFLLLLPAVSGIVAMPAAKSPKRRAPRQRESTQRTPHDRLPIKPFVTHYRGNMIVATCTSILAVDFRIFPRRFAKVENWGTSLMDLGVGSFVFSAGLVGARSVLKESVSGRKAAPFCERLRGALRRSAPLLVLGLCRLYSVKGLDYAEHVTEYGVHWNFFFTLGLLPPFVALSQSGLHRSPPTALAIFLGAAYESALHFTDLTSFIITAPRVDFLSKNREGIFSFVGYLAIFLAGQATGMYTLPHSPRGSPSSSPMTRVFRSTLGRLAMWTGVWSALYWSATSYHGLGLVASRRLANLPYLLGVAAYNCGQLTVLCAIERLCFPDTHVATDKREEDARVKIASSWTLSAFNRNGLAIFLLANVLTGLVNLTLPTLDMSPLASIGVLVAYIAVLAGVALWLDRLDVSIKM